ncbi:hypothetical protein [Aequorivita sediminis]|uniref:hypothetical protein n=1 Tax=Aequorivita sediminis TaxID=3073653 RepID=UPI0028AEEBDE|nr:hypothetical protein [Aequorivita sp. F6058]
MFKIKIIKKFGFLLVATVLLSCNSDEDCNCRGKFLGNEGVFYGDVVRCSDGEPVLSQQASEGNNVTYLGCDD